MFPRARVWYGLGLAESGSRFMENKLIITPFTKEKSKQFVL